MAKRYAEYVAGKRELSRNETEQVGFRLAKEMGHATVYPVDVDGDFPFQRLMNYARGTGRTKELDLLQAEVGAMVKAQDDYLASHTILEALLYMNADEKVAQDVGFYYRQAHVGEPGDWAGADLLADWFRRNARIYAKIAGLAGSPEERVLRDLRRRAPRLAPAEHRERPDAAAADARRPRSLKRDATGAGRGRRTRPRRRPGCGRASAGRGGRGRSAGGSPSPTRSCRRATSGSSPSTATPSARARWMASTCPRMSGPRIVPCVVGDAALGDVDRQPVALPGLPHQQEERLGRAVPDRRGPAELAAQAGPRAPSRTSPACPGRGARSSGSSS